LKRLLQSLAELETSVWSGAAANNAIGGSSNQALDLTPNTAGNEPVLFAQNAAEENGARTTANVDGKGVFLKGYDTVAYFKQGKALKGNPAIESTYQGVTYLFASAANKADFDKDPAKYVAQYGGFCAYAVAIGLIEPPDAAEILLFTRESSTSGAIPTP
jgi:YHS domain-containing protein